MTLIDIFSEAERLHASDIHITGGRYPMFRILGKLVPCTLRIITSEELDALEKELLLSPSYARVLDIGMSNSLFRVVLSYSISGINLAVRILKKHASTLEDLHLPAELHDIAGSTSGLFLLAGATGSGKSTTAISMLEVALQRHIHLVTLENPIEYKFTTENSFVTQQEYGRDFNSFSTAASHAMYQDPDVIYFGELNDYSTIATALSLAETGHFVLGTIHARGAAESVTRIIDIFESTRQDFVKQQLVSCLRGVFWQELLPGEQQLYPLYELLQMTPAVCGAISQNKSAQSIRGDLHNMSSCISRIRSARSLCNLGVNIEAVCHHLTDTERTILLSRK